MNMSAQLSPAQVTAPGAYAWTDEKGVRHLGFLEQDRRGQLRGAFVAENGSIRALSITYADGGYCEGIFHGPLDLPGASA